MVNLWKFFCTFPLAASQASSASAPATTALSARQLVGNIQMGPGPPAADADARTLHCHTLGSPYLPVLHMLVIGNPWSPASPHSLPNPQLPGI